ncbi:hypothetical protein LTR36_000515 [Oleoguttula mirabilis]|uniref:Uncharacterized protein n=1 Tax=Oleoguttula mirabilis TaxID=1507867 RepID=A0AAV9JQR2_9PEZI|nr:hypothetical protein LTR36_000515 [Oleoguttula mirabilis]
MAQQATAVEQTSFLRKLSPELRNMIYELVVDDDHEIDITSEQQPALTRACRETRTESLAMYYALNTFCYETTSNDNAALDALAQWLRRTGHRNCSNIRWLHVSIGVENGFMIRDPRLDTDPWTTLVKQLKGFNCYPMMDISVSCYACELPAEEFLDEMEEEAIHTFGQHYEVLEAVMGTYLRILMTKYLGQPATGGCEGATMEDWDMLTYHRHSVFLVDYLLYDGRVMPEPPVDEDEAYEKMVRMQDGLERLLRCTG